MDPRFWSCAVMLDDFGGGEGAEIACVSPLQPHGAARQNPCGILIAGAGCIDEFFNRGSFDEISALTGLNDGTFLAARDADSGTHSAQGVQRRIQTIRLIKR